MRPTQLLQIGSGSLLLGVLVGLGVACCTAWVLHRYRHHRRVRRAARASLAEYEAAGVLDGAGYAVLGRQVRKRWSVVADGEVVYFDLIADYLVEGQGGRFVAEVKTGARALDLRYGPTRRQLLEYRQAFAVVGVLLVDAEAGRVRRVEFREPPFSSRSRSDLWPWVAMALLLGLALGRYSVQ
jgi:hypothetical protein